MTTINIDSKSFEHTLLEHLTSATAQQQDEMLASTGGALAQLAGELSYCYIEVLAIAAERAAQGGDHLKALALLRRRKFLVSRVPASAGVAFKSCMKREHESLDATFPLPPSRVGQLTMQRDVVEVELQYTLMRWSPGRVGFEGSGDRTKRWLFMTPSAWRADPAALDAHVRWTVDSVFSTCGVRMGVQEPRDANYLAPTGCRHRVLDARRILDEPWDAPERLFWEPGRYFVVDDHWWAAADPADFDPMAHLLLVRRGELGIGELLERLVARGFERADWDARLTDPDAELRDALDHYTPR